MRAVCCSRNCQGKCEEEEGESGSVICLPSPPFVPQALIAPFPPLSLPRCVMVRIRKQKPCFFPSSILPRRRRTPGGIGSCESAPPPRFGVSRSSFAPFRTVDVEISGAPILYIHRGSSSLYHDVKSRPPLQTTTVFLFGTFRRGGAGNTQQQKWVTEMNFLVGGLLFPFFPLRGA